MVLCCSIIIKLCSLFIYRRGYAATSTGSMKVNGAAMMNKGGDQDSKKSTPWVPDPVTGYYKPEGQTNQLDAAELRELFSKQKTRRN